MLGSTGTAAGCLAVSGSRAGGCCRESWGGGSIGDSGIAIVLRASTVEIIMFEIINGGQVGVSMFVLVKQRLPIPLAQGRFLSVDHGC